jgi:hypothetical protein
MPTTAKTAQLVWDKRCTGKEGDELLFISDGQQQYDDKNVVHFIVVFHKSYLCFELVVYTSARLDKVWARFFIHQFAVFDKTNEEGFKKMVEEKKEFFRKRHRHFTLDSIEAEVRNDIATNLMKSIIVDLINYDCYQRILNQPVETVTTIVRDLFGNPAEYKAYDLAKIGLLSPKPDCLVPVNTEKLNMEAKYKQYLQSERLRNHVQLAVEIMQANLKPKTLHIAMRSSNNVSGTNFFDFSGIMGSIRSSFSGAPGSSQYDLNNHSKYPVETPNRGFKERLRRRFSAMFTSSTSKKSTSSSNASTPRSAKILPTQSTADMEISAAKGRWLKATNRVINRNLHQQVNEVLRERSMRMEISPSETGQTNANTTVNTTSSSPLASQHPQPQRQGPPLSSLPAAEPALVGETRQKPETNGKKSFGNRFMSWAGFGGQAKTVNGGAGTANSNNSSSNNNGAVKASLPFKVANRDPSSRSLSSGNSAGSHHSEQSLRKFKTQYPLSHQVAAERQQQAGGSVSVSSVNNSGSSLHRHAEQSLNRTQSPAASPHVSLVAEP